MLIDDITIRVRAGSGGDGIAAFNKNLNQFGPAGGSGGKGGSVYVEGSTDIGALRNFRFKKEFAAENGKSGRGQFCDGSDAPDLTLLVPVGTVVHNLTTKTDREVLYPGERMLLANAGKGGRGNFHFRSPTNTKPRKFERGRPGEEYVVRFELRMIADIGLIGLPNAGKSSLLNELTEAKSKVANYAFTTLEPNLGVYYDIILADIPGLIEGASGGKGLGMKFLRHIERTRVLFHIIGADSSTSAADYRIIRKELGAYNKALLKRKEYILVSKSDEVSPADLKKKVALLKKSNPAIMAYSIHDFESIEKIKKILGVLIKKKLGKKL
ncbi:MAG: hypothetical protein A3I44_03295 [Candidatus Sungbacteria bacterium RIFCSPLOWO2_02_FULL_51_17]|uniref:GTPase Obg n=1 Tax=Candidatus Sungbacteria bacterium RIFCSPHIGHO2_02_FULL_51_29 TaxID=1802273 RepID=A0A1G2KWE7_9BACT|nr:MAG: hypothetical protein A2676_06210 [Candidatus Sungbacteria bacterium RIFCSPHIGHO2_01_FULL_51_22]OHA03767.1 MAG: hypothetical protein A3C16_03340 [Candidatus Sungbacteria bacterium RIFCSPHIGHO2_02_FULL_51_29]OHA06584.1 MAG: hypothetical protein A3B29_02250 [Candidatus Sungbacteria bacterium RIFCSPLOWO2_01_FULL_51_34]OHA10525.1 MAG: hypothetical protein A3I44_03295 [Candidatus Sungbacteria bacterium RIFCSPLOWO2_02_FULL_51_17]